MELKKIRGKKGYYYTLDAFIALIIILAVLLIIKPMPKQVNVESYSQNDLINVLSSLKVGEFDNLYTQTLLNNKVASENLTLLEQIAEFYAKGMPEAQLLSNEIFSMLQPKENIGIWFNNELVASSSSLPFDEAERIWTARQIVSGIEKPGEGDIKGYSARAFLTRSSQVKYFYFGGYAGDGKVSVEIDYEGTLTDMQMEITTNRDFNMYIDGEFSGQYEKSPDEFTPQRYTNLGYSPEPGSIIEFRGVDGNLYIAGGYIKIVYENSGNYEYLTKYHFPGIEGIINIYDSFYIPGTLNSLSASLHLDSQYTAFLTIGDVRVYEGTTAGEQTITLDNSQLSSLLDYNSLSKETIPIRLGLEEVQDLIGGGNADVVLITDLSGSMNFKMDADEQGIERDCGDLEDPNNPIFNLNTKRLSLARCLDKMFIDEILSVEGNRVSLAAFYAGGSGNKGITEGEDFTENADYLKNVVDGYWARGGTCICCAVNAGYKFLNEQSGDGRKRFIVIMSDGIPTHQCGSQGNDECQGPRTGLTENDRGLWLGAPHCEGTLEDCETADCQCGSTNTIWSSCRAYNDLQSKIYSVGFGPVGSCTMADTTLRESAECGEGTYYSSNDPDALKDIYDEIAQEILEIAYVEQVADVSDLFETTTLYPDSYLQFSYQADEIPFGLLVTTETLFQDEYSGVFNIPSDSTPVEAQIISYSGPRWNKFAEIDSTPIYNLSEYALDYIELGDPYVIRIPVEDIILGDNLVSLFTGTSPDDESPGSIFNKIIFTILKEAIGYSPILAIAEGCTWTIEFFDFSTTEIKVPQDYEGTATCSYTSSIVSFNPNDAINFAVNDLLSSLDLNSDGKIDTKFSEENFEIDSSEISGIPYTYSSEVQVRVWR